MQQRTVEGRVDSPAVPPEPVSERIAETPWDVPGIPAEVVEMPSAFQDQRFTDKPNVDIAVPHTAARRWDAAATSRRGAAVRGSSAAH